MIITLLFSFTERGMYNQTSLRRWFHHTVTVTWILAQPHVSGSESYLVQQRTLSRASWAVNLWLGIMPTRLKFCWT